MDAEFLKEGAKQLVVNAQEMMCRKREGDMSVAVPSSILDAPCLTDASMQCYSLVILLPLFHKLCCARLWVFL